MNGGRESSFSDENLQYLQVYIDESHEELEGLVGAILQLEENPRHAESLNKAFRMLHSLKGSSGMLGFEVVGNFAHELEDRFEAYRSGQRQLDRETTTIILKCIDFFREFLDRLRAGDHSEGNPSALLEQLRLQEQGKTEKPKASAASVLPAMTFSGGIKVVIRFREGLQLADLKARLIVSRLSSIGEIIACDPPVDDVRSFDELSLFSLTIVTDRPIDEVRKIANVDGVVSLQIERGELTVDSFTGRSTEPTETFPDTSTQSTASSEPIEPRVETPFQEVPPQATTEVAASAEVERVAAETKVGSSETLRVDIGRLDHLMNLTGELVIANARLGQLSREMSPLFRHGAAVKRSRELSERMRQRFEIIRGSLGQSDLLQQWDEISAGLDEDLDLLDRQTELWSEGQQHFGNMGDAVDQLTRVSKNLQRGVLSTRMVPVGPLFTRFKRVIRDLSVERKKQVQLVIQGEKTELDKRMIDELSDPLLHLVRNSIDHGLEPPEQRREAGKAEMGTISMEAAHRGNNVFITIRDDGGGINIERVRARIVDRGLATAAQAQEMPEQQVIGYIWHPGFSTAQAVTEISGRGVGMDIVRSAISGLSGSIDVSSQAGVGTTFTIRLPLTLAIIHSLMMRYRGEYFSIPIDDVREIVSIPRDQVYTVHRHVSIDVRGELIPLVSMGGAFRWNASNEPGTDASATSGQGPVNVVVLNSRGKSLGLSVDSLVGRADLVIKSLAENYQPVRGISGASVLGDGAVCLMLDPTALVELASERALTKMSRT